jgi:hypothetical protein
MLLNEERSKSVAAQAMDSKARSEQVAKVCDEASRAVRSIIGLMVEQQSALLHSALNDRK